MERKKYQTLEKEHLDNLKSTTYDVKIDVLARAKKLSHETNKRRRAQALKRKKEALLEEKRRKEILAKRHEEQTIATERFQRSHCPNSRPTSSKTYKCSSTVEDALRLVRGSPTTSRQNSFIHHGGRTSPLPAGNYPSDPLNRPYLNNHKIRHRPLSPTSPKSRGHNEMNDTSLRNWNGSRSLFEQQLEQHQQLLLDQQQKSLYEFNEAISNEIARDRKVNGTEDEDKISSHLNLKNSESFSSVDSLNDSLNIPNKSPSKTLETEDQDNVNFLAHNLIYPVSSIGGPKGSFYLETKSDINLQKDNEKVNVIQPCYYDITAHSWSNTVGYIPNCTPVSTVSNVKPMFSLKHGLLQPNVSTTVNEVQDDRPMSHVKTWVDPEKETLTNGVTNQRYDTGVGNISTVAAYDITSTPQVKPRTIFTSNTTTNSNSVGSNSNKIGSVHKNTVNAHDTASSGLRSDNNTHSVNTAPNTSHKPNSSGLQYESHNSGTTSHKTTASQLSHSTTNKAPDTSTKTTGTNQINGSILSGTLHLVNGQLATGSHFVATSTPEKSKIASKFPASYSCVEERPTIIERSESKENIVGILKKSPSGTSLKSIESRDSLEIIKLKRQGSEDSSKRPKSGKKSVRFADLSDDEEPDSLASSYSGQEINKKIHLKGTKGKSRPSSAKVVSKMARVPPSAPKPPRAASAGTIRNTSKPKAAAHIITHDPFQTEQSETYYKNLQSHLEKKVTVVNNNFLNKTDSKSGDVGTNQTVVTSKPPLPVQLKMTDASKHIPTNSTSPPQSTKPVANQPVFDVNGLRIDRTPTDDEINQLWETVRTCLHPDDEDTSQTSQTQSDSMLVSRQKAPLSSTVIDGGFLGSVGQPPRIGSGHQRTASKAYQVRQVAQTPPNGYLKKYGLLQQRRQQDKAANQAPTVKRENYMPQLAQSHTSPTKREDLVSDSMSLFMMAEQLTNQAVPENHIHQAMDDLQSKQLMNGNRNKVPSALSIEEQQLIESLDRLNNKLKNNEKNYPQVSQTPSSNQTITVSNTSQSPGFRGRRPITGYQRRHTDGVARDYLIRAASAHSLSQRQYR